MTGILLVYVIPVFADLFNSFGQALPAPTQFVINLSNFTISYFWLLLGGIIATIAGFVFAYAHRPRPLLASTGSCSASPSSAT